MGSGKGELYTEYLDCLHPEQQGAQRLQDTDYTKLHYDSNALRADEQALVC